MGIYGNNDELRLALIREIPGTSSFLSCSAQIDLLLLTHCMSEMATSSATSRQPALLKPSDVTKPLLVTPSEYCGKREDDSPWNVSPKGRVHTAQT